MPDQTDRPDQRAFTAAELEEAGPCVHSIKKADCASCVKHRFWYEGRIDGLREAAALLAQNNAMVDAMRESVIEAEKQNPPYFFNDRLVDRA